MLCCGWLGSGLDDTTIGLRHCQREFGLGTKEVHGTICDFRLSQEEQKTGRGLEGLNTQAQWEENHDQRKGVRIGEARKPGHNGAAPKQEKTWTGLTANIT
eukprot:2915384-Heterocapsa_arctica.AAC.1